jgi:hypothetical protein
VNEGTNGDRFDRSDAADSDDRICYRIIEWRYFSSAASSKTCDFCERLIGTRVPSRSTTLEEPDEDTTATTRSRFTIAERWMREKRAGSRRASTRPIDSRSRCVA